MVGILTKFLKILRENFVFHLHTHTHIHTNAVTFYTCTYIVIEELIFSLSLISANFLLPQLRFRGNSGMNILQNIVTWSFVVIKIM